METFCTIDWISFTDTEKQPGTGYLVPWYLNDQATTPTIPRFGYRKAVTTPLGNVIMWDGATGTMGVHYQYNGRAITALMAAGVHPVSILVEHIEMGHRCSRLDLAIDVRGIHRFAQRLAMLAEMHKYRGTCRSIHIVRSVNDDGITTYCGSRQSERFARLYDKGVESGEGSDWARLEMELKGDVARGVARHLTSQQIGGLFLATKTLLTALIDFDDDDWRDIMGGEGVPITAPQIKERDTEKWLLTQVTIAIARYDKAHPERDIWRQFIDTVEALMRTAN